MRISDWSSDVCSSDLLRPSASAQSDGKNDEIEQRRDRRCPDRLELDLEEPPHLLHIERAKPAPIDVPDHGHAGDRKSVVSGKRVSVRVDLGGRRIIKKKTSNVTNSMIRPVSKK